MTIEEMTIEELNLFIQGFCVCRGRNSPCEDCPLDFLCDKTSGNFLKHEKECVQAAKIITSLPSIHNVTTTIKENPYWERICELANYQRTKGIGKYGKGLEDNPTDMIARIQHLQEELIDGLMYCEWIKDKLMELEGEKHD